MRSTQTPRRQPPAPGIGPGRTDLSRKPGFSPGLEIVRYLLDTCATAEEAREALESIETYYFLLPCHYIIGDTSGDSFVWEYTPDLTERFVTDGDGDPQCITNHSLQRYAGSREFRQSLQSSSSVQRYRTLVKETAADDSLKSHDDMKRIHRQVAAADPASSLRLRYQARLSTV